jgi:hypothetical protein
MANNKLPYRYHYRSLASRIIATIPDNISIFIPAPFENISYNKYYLLLCRYLHPETNMVCIHDGSRIVPITSREVLKMYMGVVSYPTYRRFILEAMQLNLLMIVKAINEKEYYIINPVYASHKTLKFNEISKFFTVVSSFSGELIIDEKYIKNDIKSLSDERMLK